jgi:polysaccharide export outer membrane protein
MIADMKTALGCAVVALALMVGRVGAVQQPAPQQPPPTPATPAPGVDQQASLPADYVIGPDDKLGVLFWRDESMTADVTVRPDGKISLPLLNDVHVVGLTPEQLRTFLMGAAKKFVADPTVSVVVREINSRKVFITGFVSHPGAYSLTTPITVLQLIAIAGGLTDFADTKKITIIRAGQKEPLKFNYEDVRRGKNLQQNILLKVGDTVVVPG